MQTERASQDGDPRAAGPGEAITGPGEVAAGPTAEATAGPAAEATAGPTRRSRRGVTVVVGAAIIAGDRVLACARASPPEAAGKWEFPGGKVELEETETDALVRECAEELAVQIEVGDRVGRNVRMSHGRAVLKVYAARLLGDAAPQALEHAELRWLSADELETVPWMPADVPIVAALRPFLLRGGAERERTQGRTDPAA